MKKEFMKSPEQLLELFNSDTWRSKCYVLLDQAVETALLEVFLQSGLQARTSGQFKAAEIGRGLASQREARIRGDSTCWVTEDLCPDLVQFCQALQKSLNENLFLSLKKFECHWACYESHAGYETHIDEHQSGWAVDRRYLSFVLYLNSNWQKGDGGELELYPDSPESLLIEPLWGRLVMFDSTQVPHRVLPSLKPRWSLTGWFRR
jgi:SM-20-related protein